MSSKKILSDRQIASDILDNKINLLDGWLDKKKRQEKILRFAQIFPRLTFWIGIRLIRKKFMEKRLAGLISPASQLLSDNL